MSSGSSAGSDPAGNGWTGRTIQARIVLVTPEVSHVTRKVAALTAPQVQPSPAVRAPGLRRSARLSPDRGASFVHCRYSGFHAWGASHDLSAGCTWLGPAAGFPGLAARWAWGVAAGRLPVASPAACLASSRPITARSEVTESHGVTTANAPASRKRCSNACDVARMRMRGAWRSYPGCSIKARISSAGIWPLTTTSAGARLRMACAADRQPFTDSMISTSGIDCSTVRSASAVAPGGVTSKVVRAVR